MKHKFRIVWFIVAVLMVIVTLDSCTAILKMPAKGFAKTSLRKATIKEGTENAGKLGIKEALSTTKVYSKLGCRSGKELCQLTVKKASQIPDLSSSYLSKHTDLGIELGRIEQKGPIILSSEEYYGLLDNANSGGLITLISKKTGNGQNFQEFFIRLANGNPDQVKSLLSQHYIKEYIEGAIRRSNGGHNHEWLMCKNFEDFLVNPKWGKGGKYLALAMTELVQKTRNVVFKNGGAHGSTNSKIFHDKLSEIITNSRTAHEVLGNINMYASKVLTPESYREFRNILKDMLRAYCHSHN